MEIWFTQQTLRFKVLITLATYKSLHVDRMGAKFGLSPWENFTVFEKIVLEIVFGRK
jgi:hypothetical protein